MDEHFILSKSKIENLTHEDFLFFTKISPDNELIFDNFIEMKNFLMSIAKAYPDGVPESYVMMKMQTYAYNKHIGRLKEQGIIEVFEDEDGNEQVKLTPYGEATMSGMGYTW